MTGALTGSFSLPGLTASRGPLASESASLTLDWRVDFVNTWAYTAVLATITGATATFASGATASTILFGGTGSGALDFRSPPPLVCGFGGPMDFDLWFAVGQVDQPPEPIHVLTALNDAAYELSAEGSWPEGVPIVGPPSVEPPDSIPDPLSPEGLTHSCFPWLAPAPSYSKLPGSGVIHEDGKGEIVMVPGGFGGVCSANDVTDLSLRSTITHDCIAVDGAPPQISVSDTGGMFVGGDGFAHARARPRQDVDIVAELPAWCAYGTIIRWKYRADATLRWGDSVVCRYAFSAMYGFAPLYIAQGETDPPLERGYCTVVA